MKIMVAFLGKNKQKKKINSLAKEIKQGHSIERFLNNQNVKSPKSKLNLKKLKSNNIVSRQTISNISNIFSKNRYNNKENHYNFSSEEKVIDFKLKYIIVGSFFSVILFALVAKLGLTNYLLRFSTNFRQAEENDLEIADLISVYNMYNQGNYIFEKIEQEEIQKVEKPSTEIEIIDSLAKEAETMDVFGKKDVTVTVTDETSTLQRVNVDTFKVLNYSGKRNIDFASLLNSNIVLTKKSDKILLYNTHTSESYSNSEKYKFEYTGTMRTTDANYNMLVIAKELSKNLTQKGFECVQNTTPHDYGTYTSAYAKSRVTVQNALTQINGAGIMIDVHRDAAGDLSYRPVVNINGVQVAQVMLVMGVGTSSVPNENWEENLKLALKLQQLADKVYPGLFRPMYIRNSVYNQDLNKYSLLMEFGATGNTIEEVMLSTRCIANLLNIIYKD